jgi:hypothetical protein
MKAPSKSNHLYLQGLNRGQPMKNDDIVLYWPDTSFCYPLQSNKDARQAGMRNIANQVFLLR